jgi:membrane glycosyltransferase
VGEQALEVAPAGRRSARRRFGAHRAGLTKTRSTRRRAGDRKDFDIEKRCGPRDDARAYALDDRATTAGAGCAPRAGALDCALRLRSPLPKLPMRLATRRCCYAMLVAATVAGLTTWLALLLAPVGSRAVAALMVAAFAVKAAWVAINFWSAAIGLVLLRRGVGVAPGLAPPDARPIEGRVAIAMTARDEAPAPTIARLRAVKASLDASPDGALFDYFLLSDASRPEIAAAEERLVEAWRGETSGSGRVFYRRRALNHGGQHGNLYDFAERFAAPYAILIALDADSLMSAAAILALVRLMQANPRVGILQSVDAAILPPSLFARVFEFGHRHAMRCSAAGSAWWQGPRGQYRGHNAAIRVGPYLKHCRLVDLAGERRFGGVGLCHDQIESALMRRAGWEIRELSRETGSWEGAPPTLPDFLDRYRRWFQGDLNNLRFLGLAGLTAMDRYHLIAVAHRFLAWPAMVMFAALALVMTLTAPAPTAFPTRSAAAFIAAFAAIYFAPRVLGYVDSAFEGAKRCGGAARLIVGGALDALLTLLFTPVAMLAGTTFVVALAAGRRPQWDAQPRASYRLTWRAAARRLWRESAIGWAALAALALAKPSALPWFAPFLAGPALAIPLAAITASPRLGRLAARWKVCALPEEIDVPAEIGATIAFEAALSRDA